MSWSRCVSRRRISCSRTSWIASTSIACSRSRFASQARQASAFTSTRLPLGQAPDFVPSCVGPRLPISSVCWLSRACASAAEKSARRSDSDLMLKGAAAGDDRLLGAGVDAVVAHVADAAQDDALREAAWAVGIAGAQLPQHGDEPYRPPERRSRR